MSMSEPVPLVSVQVGKIEDSTASELPLIVAPLIPLIAAPLIRTMTYPSPPHPTPPHPTPAHQLMFPLREAFSDLLQLTKPAQERAYWPATCGGLVLAYLLAVFVPSLWILVSFVGCIAGTALCFMYPASMVLLEKADVWTDMMPLMRPAMTRALAVGVIAAGFLIMVLGLFSLFCPNGECMK